MASSSNLTRAARAVHLFKINGYSATKAMAMTEHVASKRLTVGGYPWEIHYTPRCDASWHYWIAFKLVFLGQPRVAGDTDAIKASLICRLLPCGPIWDSTLALEEKSKSHAFRATNESSLWVLLVRRKELEASCALNGDSFTVECTITVLCKTTIDPAEPSSDLHRHLGELLRSGKMADVFFVVSGGEAIPAHRCVIAARSPALAAVVSGGTRRTDGSLRVEIKDMDADVLRALLHFIYTDTFSPPAKRVTVTRLYEAGDRFGLERLKLICEEKFALDASDNCTVM